MPHPIRAITFDLWDTVIVDDSDEPERARRQLLPKSRQRRRLLWEFLEKQAPIRKDLVDLAYDTGDAAFRQVWYGQNVTWTVEQLLGVILKGLGRTLPAPDQAELIRLHEEMELEVQPDMAPGIGEALKALHGKYKLGVVSDTLFSPGRALRELLDANDLLQYFDAFVFSDEVGHAKPDSRVFDEVARQLDVPLEGIVHIGDRERKDIAGAHRVGARAIYTTVVLDRGSDKTTAEAVCRDYNQLPAIVEALDQSAR